MYDLNYTNTQYNANINDLFASPKEQNIISEYSKLSIKEILKYMELEMFKYNKKVDFKVKKLSTLLTIWETQWCMSNTYHLGLRFFH